MAGMKTVLFGLCLLVGVVHGFSVDHPDPSWQFSDVANTGDDHQGSGGRLVPDNGFHYSFSQLDGGVTNQFSENTFADLPDTQEAGSFSDESYVYSAKPQGNAAPYDYNNNQFSTQQDEPVPSYALGVPQERNTRPDYVYDASAGTGSDGASFSTLDTHQGSPGDQASSYVYDARSGSGDDSTSLSALSSPPADDTAVPATGHQGPVQYYTPSSNPDGAFNFYDARSDGEKNDTSTPDEYPDTGAESFAENHDGTSDTTTASTSPILASTKAPQGTHGCPNTYWAAHVAQWPAQLKINTPVCKAFQGVNLQKNLEIVYGSTTVFQALLDTRKSPYSALMRNAVAALLNAYKKPAFPLKPVDVSKLFHSALASKAAAAAQAQKFENENHAFGDSECK